VADLGDGIGVTMSFGVSASTRGTPFEYEPVFAAADEALYAAKADGRDCVGTPGAIPELATA
jgi:GGDEF domain-containing protein